MTDLITAEEAEKLLDHYGLPTDCDCNDEDCVKCSHYPTLQERASKKLKEISPDLARTIIALHAQLADAKAAQAMVVERAVGVAKRHRSKVQINEPLWHDGQDWASDRIAEAIEALADTDGITLVQALRAERDEAKRLMEMRHREMLAADELMRKHQRRADKAEADRDRLAAANAALEARLANGMKWCDLMDGPVSKSQFVNGQATAAQQIRAALAEVQADARREGGE